MGGKRGISQKTALERPRDMKKGTNEQEIIGYV